MSEDEYDPNLGPCMDLDEDDIIANCEHENLEYLIKPTGTMVQIVMVRCKTCGYEDEDLLDITYGADYMIGDLTFKRIVSRGNYSKCVRCGLILTGTNDKDFPMILFIDEGRQGELDFCRDCFNLLVEKGYIKIS
ncbi:MAG: hypothetical protein HXX80_07425 [Nitrososphaerales archaeon]|nr:hypothetical protein [Nitrososphaerales archaeon]